MIRTFLVSPVNKKKLDIGKGIRGSCTLITSTLPQLEGSFKAVTRTTAGTSIITEPDTGGALLLTDLIITTDKVALSTVTIRFTDDTNTINIVAIKCNDAPANFAIPFSGRWSGWKNSRLEIVTVANVSVTAACGYIKIPESETLNFEKWDSLR